MLAPPPPAKARLPPGMRRLGMVGKASGRPRPAAQKDVTGVGKWRGIHLMESNLRKFFEGIRNTGHRRALHKRDPRRRRVPR